MPPKKLTKDEEAFVAHWSKRQFYFMAMTRQADLYLRTVPRETQRAAYQAIATSGWVVGGDWDNPDKGDTRTWQPEREDREKSISGIWKLLYNVILLYLLKSKLHSRLPTHLIYWVLKNSANMVIFASNANQMVIMSSIVMDRPKAVRDRFWDQVHKLNNADLQATKERRRGPDENTLGLSGKNPIDRDPDEDPNYEPFVRKRPFPRTPTSISPSLREWKRFEKVGETYFIRDDNDTTGYTALELAGIVQLTRGTFYKMRYEGSVDSIRLTEEELLELIEAGMWF